MTWKTNSVTFVQCDDPNHAGDSIHRVETSYTNTARAGMQSSGWGYDHDKGLHICPQCVSRNISRRRAN